MIDNKSVPPPSIPTERLVLLFLFALVVLGLIVYVLILIGKEVLRRLDIWVIQRARYLEELNGGGPFNTTNSSSSHKSKSAKSGRKHGSSSSNAVRKRHGSVDDSYSGESNSDSGSD